MCTPSRTSLMTGYFPAQHGVLWTIEEDMPDTNYPQIELPLPDQLDNIATVATSAGYEAVFKGKFHMVKKSEGPDGNWTQSDVGKYGWARWNPPVSMRLYTYLSKKHHVVSLVEFSLFLSLALALPD